jgi:hypothetical protein
MDGPASASESSLPDRPDARLGGRRMKLAGTVFVAVIAGSVLVGLQSMPTVDATCHCLTSTCYFTAYDNNPKNGKFDDAERSLMTKEEGECKEDIVVRLASELISGAASVEIYLIADHVTLTGDGGVTIGGSGGTLVIRTTTYANATVNGTFRAMAAEGLTFTTPSEVPLSGISRIAFTVEEAETELAVPYVIHQPGAEDQMGTLAFATGDTGGGGGGGMTFTEGLMVAGFVGFLLGAVIAAVVVLAARRS